MNKLAPVIFLLLMLCGAALWFLANGSLNLYIKSQIESIGQQLTKQSVLVKTVDLKPAEAKGYITGLTINNPEQFNQNDIYTPAIEVASIEFNIALNNQGSTVYVIDSIIINGLIATMITLNDQSNIETLLTSSKLLIEIL